MNISKNKQILIVYFVLTLAAMAVFGQVYQFGFVNFDDPLYVEKNNIVRSGISLNGIIWAFSIKYHPSWFPLTWFSFMFDYQFFGLNAAGYHATNLVLHILTSLLLFRLFNRMTGAIWRSAFIAAVFALHPLHVETVAWITKRKDLLSAFFWMLTLCLYVFYTEKPVIRRYLLVFFSFILALMSKPMVITLPVMMILLDYWPLGRFKSQKKNLLLWQFKEKMPFFVLSVFFLLITLLAHYKPDRQDSPYPLASRLTNATVSFINYLGKMLWPHDLAAFYPFSDQIPVVQFIGASLLIIIITVFVILMVKRVPYLFVGWFWYAITIMPVIGIIPVNLRGMSDNYTYLPSIGIALMLAWGIPLLFTGKNLRKKILLPAGMVIIAILAVLAWRQCGYWKNSIELWDHAIRATKNNYFAHNCFAAALVEKGRFDEAIDNYNKSILLEPNFADVFFNRGIAYGKLGRYRNAIEDYNETMRLNPNYTDAYNNRGTVYHELGQYQQAITDYNEVIRLKPDHADAYNNRGLAYGKLGRYQQAIEDFRKAVLLKPDYVAAYNNRGFAYLLQGDKEMGCRDAQKACELGMCGLLEAAKVKGYCP